MTAGSDENSDRRLILVLADKGRQQQAENSSERYLVMESGYRIEGVPGQNDYQITRFEEYGSRLEDSQPSIRKAKTDAMETSLLLGSSDPELQATLQWRLSIPLMVLVVTILAVPLSRTNNRQGRYGKLLPAIALYFTYLVALNGMRGALESGAIPIYVTLLPVHGLYLGIALLLLRSGAPKKSNAVVTDGEVAA